ncbi:Hsp70 family protein [Dactylosporangium sp. CA-092794]|uniref:Hsp70 family protein n=1 Tax=Dactylosporangium sp. CA-092794 TaxID=3239929 RepID=UPI003D8B1F64
MRLGIDFGTSTTVAVLQRSDGRVQQLLFDGSPLLASAVLLGVDGRLHTGRDAAHLARSAPERLEPNPKRRIDERAVLLADAEVGVAELVGAVLGRVAVEAGRVGGAVREVVLTHPADWGSARRAVLVEAARRVGFGDVELVAEPLAAAAAFTATHGGALRVGSFLLVYDLGAGTCDITLLRRESGGFRQVASHGLNDVGGLDVDAAIVAALQGTYGALWSDPGSRRQLWDEVRSAKEMLSRAAGTVIMVPALRREVPLGREELEALARPVLRTTIGMTVALLREAGVGTGDIGGLFLVGGSSRIPLVATMLHDALGVAPTVAEQPELVVAEGALRLTAPAEAAPTVAEQAALRLTVPAEAEPTVADQPALRPAARLAAETARPPIQPPPDRATTPDRPTRARWKGVVAAAAALVLAFGAFATYVTIRTNQDDGGDLGGGATPSLAATKYDFAKAPDDLCAAVDLKPFAALYESREEEPRADRNLTDQISTANCQIRLVHQKGAILALFVVSVTVRADPAAMPITYQQLVSGSAQNNLDPVELTGIGDKAVVYTNKGTSQQAKTELTLIVGAMDGNLIWQLRLSATRRTDTKGWTAAEVRDQRDKLVEVTRASLPKLAAAFA